MTGGSVVESNPTVGAVIVNYRSEEETHRLTAELYEGVDELVIVDNSSPSATLDQLARSTERVSYLESDGNVGYAAGNNLGIQHLSEECDCYFIINPDTNLPDIEVVSRLARKILVNPEVGILAPAVGDDPPSQQHRDTAAVRLMHRFGYLPSVGSRDDELVPRTQVVGCSMMISADMIEDIGLLDPSFFLYVEEIEYCFRAREHGYQVAFDPESVVEHNHEETGFVHTNPYQVYYRTRNLFQLARRRFSGVGQLLFLSSVGILLYVITRNQEWTLLKPWFEGFVDGVLGRTGRTRYLTD